MFTYEVLMLTVPEITKDELATVESHVDKLVQGVKGSMVSFERWGKYKLAFPIRKQEYGVYCLVRFNTPVKEELLKDIRVLLGVKFEGSIMRFVVTRLADGASLAYQRPLSLEEAPAKTASSFLKEKGLMNDDFGRKGRDFEDAMDVNGQDNGAELA